MRGCGELEYKLNRLLGPGVENTPHTLVIVYVNAERLGYKLPDTAQDSVFGTSTAIQGVGLLFYMVQRYPIARTISGVLPASKLVTVCRATRARVAFEIDLRTVYQHTARMEVITRVHWSPA